MAMKIEDKENLIKKDNKVKNKCVLCGSEEKVTKYADKYICNKCRLIIEIKLNF